MSGRSAGYEALFGERHSASANDDPRRIWSRDHYPVKLMHVLILLCWACVAQATSPVVVENVRSQVGDNVVWPEPGYNDSAWPLEAAFRAAPQGRPLCMRPYVDAPAATDAARL